MVRTKWRVSFEWVNNLNERAAWCRCINGRRAFAKSISFSLQPDVHNNGQNWQAWFLSQTLHSLPTTRSCGKINTTVGLALSQWLGEEAQCSSSEVRHALEEQLADHKPNNNKHTRGQHTCTVIPDVTLTFSGQPDPASVLPEHKSYILWTHLCRSNQFSRK